MSPAHDMQVTCAGDMQMHLDEVSVQWNYSYFYSSAPFNLFLLNNMQNKGFFYKWLHPCSYQLEAVSNILLSLFALRLPACALWVILSCFCWNILGGNWIFTRSGCHLKCRFHSFQSYRLNNFSTVLTILQIKVWCLLHIPESFLFNSWMK